MPYIAYSNMVDHFIEDVYDFVSKHPEYELNRYYDILEINNIKWERNPCKIRMYLHWMGNVLLHCLWELFGQNDFAMVYYSHFQKWCNKKWLLRLKEIDEE